MAAAADDIVERAARELLRRRRARQHLLDYATYMTPNWQPSARLHTVIAEHIERVERREIDRLIVTCSPQHGKQIADHVPVWTTRGWVPHGELRVGDEVFGPDGKPVRVLAVGEPAMQDCEVEFTDGVRVPCHERHEWALFDCSVRKMRVVETGSLEPLALMSGGRARFTVPARAALSMPDAELPLHPYALGAWLGDGTSTAGTMCGGEEDLGVIRHAMTACGLSNTSNWVQPRTRVHYAYFSGITTVLRKLGVFGAKHIPLLYKLASIDQRLELLAGLIDTDGYVYQHDQRVCISTVSEALRGDICDVVRSMGWRATVYAQQPRMSSSGIDGRKVVYQITFTPDRPIPTRIERKRIVGKPGCVRRAGVRAVWRVAPVLGRCIQVDRDDGLYLVGREMVVTHNSELGSRKAPAWKIGRNPTRSIITASATALLAEGFGRDVRNQVESGVYRALFPEVSLAEDSKAKGLWHTKQGGMYFATSVGAGAYGRGGEDITIDDPFASWADAQSALQRQNVWDWYTGTILNRLRPGGTITVIAHRLHEDDLIGRLLAQQVATGDKWTVVDIPALNDAGESSWPERYTPEFLERIRIQTPESVWEAMYMQRPSSEGGGIVKRADWRMWPAGVPLPAFDFVLMSLDTAFSEKHTDLKKNKTDFSACSVWGCVRLSKELAARLTEVTGRACYERQPVVLLLDAWAERLGFPDLVERVKREKDVPYGYEERAKPLIGERSRVIGRKPDLIVVEDKGSGISLRQVLAREGIFTQGYNPGKADKLERLHIVSPMFRQGCVWGVESNNRPGTFRTWADPLIRQVCSFRGEGSIEYDDLMDSATQALRVIRDVWLERAPATAPTHAPIVVNEYGFGTSDEAVYG